MQDKYIIKNLCDITINDNKVIINNNFEGTWTKIPVECYRAIEYAIEKNIPINKLVEAFESKEDREYFKNVIKKLDLIGLLSNELVENIKLNFIPKVVFSLTNRCNLNCDYCCEDSKIDEKDTLTTNDLKKCIDNILKLNPQRIVFTGGEPLLRADFFEILKYTKKMYRGKIILCTNATLINYEHIDIISRDIYSLEISIDGFDEQSCSEIRGKGVFGKVIKNVKELQKKGMKKIALSMVVGNHNVENIEKFYEFNRILGTKPVIRAFSKSGRGIENCSKYLDENLVEYRFEDEFKDVNNLRGDHCQAGRTQIGINPDGNIYVCPVLQMEEFKIGNILDIDGEMIEKILNSDVEAIHNFDALKPKNMDKCKECKLNLFCIECPEKSYLLQQDNKKFDSYCNYVKEQLYSKI